MSQINRSRSTLSDTIISNTVFDSNDVWEVNGFDCSCDGMLCDNQRPTKVQTGVTMRRINRAPLDIESTWKTMEDLMPRLRGEVGALYDGMIVTITHDGENNGMWLIHEWNENSDEQNDIQQNDMDFSPENGFMFYPTRVGDNTSIRSGMIGWGRLEIY